MLLEEMYKFIIEGLKLNDQELDVMQQFKGMIVAMGQANHLNSTEEIKEEDLCPICFTRASDCRLLPCEHTCCKKCIQTHL